MGCRGSGRWVLGRSRGSYRRRRWRRPVVLAVLLVKAHRPGKPLADVDMGSPLKDPPDFSVVNKNRADVNGFTLGRKWQQPVCTAASHVDEHLRQLAQTDRL